MRGNTPWFQEPGCCDGWKPVRLKKLAKAVAETECMALLNHAPPVHAFVKGKVSGAAGVEWLVLQQSG
jgi:hypothetical protein